MADSKNKHRREKPPLPLCSCHTDPFAALPPEARPRPRPRMGKLRRVTCPGCGLVYWTNRPTDLCAACSKKSTQSHS